MSLESDLKQKKFKSSYQKAFLNIMYTNYYLINNVNSFFKDHDITRQQYNVLRILRGQHPKPITINQIRERMMDKMSDASRIVERLRVKGLVTRNQSAGDKRVVEVNISQKGLDLLTETDPKTSEFDSLLNNLSKKEIDQLNHLLDKIRD